MTLQATSTSSMAPWSPVAAVQRSPWHSPVPYLFGGLAAMLALIAFALSILACSYWKLSARQRGDLEARNGGGEAREGGGSKPGNPKESPVFEEKYLVIMAGQARPTFLATPVSSRASSFGSCSCGSNSTTSTTADTSSTMSEEEKQGSFDQVQVRTMENRETANQLP